MNDSKVKQMENVIAIEKISNAMEVATKKLIVISHDEKISQSKEMQKTYRFIEET